MGSFSIVKVKENEEKSVCVLVCLCVCVLECVCVVGFLCLFDCVYL